MQIIYFLRYVTAMSSSRISKWYFGSSHRNQNRLFWDFRHVQIKSSTHDVIDPPIVVNLTEIYLMNTDFSYADLTHVIFAKSYIMVLVLLGLIWKVEISLDQSLNWRIFQMQIWQTPFFRSLFFTCMAESKNSLKL